MKDIRLLQSRYLLNAYPNRGLVLNEGKGVYLQDERGESYLDFMSNYGVAILGHNHPVIIEALTLQLKRLSSLHGGFANEVRAEAARALTTRCGGGLSKVFFTNSGAEANEAALKFAVLATGRKKFVAFHNGFHGKTLGALSATAGASYRAPFEPLLWNFTFVDYGDQAGLAAIDDQTAAVLIEPIQGEGGIRIPPSGFLAEVRRISEANGAVLIIDEIQTGMGRTGSFLASRAEIPAPDIVTLGKGLAGGIPAGAVVMSDKIAATIPRKIHTSTFGGNPLAAAGILATLSVLTDENLTRVRSIGKEFLYRLQELDPELVSEVRGKGLMIGLDVRLDRDDVLRNLQREHVLAIPAGPGVVRFLPPYIIDENHIEIALRALKIALTKSKPGSDFIQSPTRESMDVSPLRDPLSGAIAQNGSGSQIPALGTGAPKFEISGSPARKSGELQAKDATCAAS